MSIHADSLWLAIRCCIKGMWTPCSCFCSAWTCTHAQVMITKTMHCISLRIATSKRLYLGSCPQVWLMSLWKKIDHALFCPSCYLTWYAWCSGIHIASVSNCIILADYNQNWCEATVLCDCIKERGTDIHKKGRVCSRMGDDSFLAIVWIVEQVGQPGKVSFETQVVYQKLVVVLCALRVWITASWTQAPPELMQP